MAAEAATPKHGDEVGCGTAGAEGRDCRCMDEMGAYVQENVQEKVLATGSFLLMV